MRREEYAIETTLKNAGCREVKPEDYTGEFLTFAWFDKKPIELKTLDTKTSRSRFQNRLDDDLNPNWVTRYTSDMKKGDKFPGIVTFYEVNKKTGKIRKSPPLIAGGNHTTEAAIAGGFTHMLGHYKFSVPEWQQKIIVDTLNNNTGIGESPEDIEQKSVNQWLQHSIDCEKDETIPKFTQGAWAKMYGIKSGRFSDLVGNSVMKKIMTGKKNYPTNNIFNSVGEHGKVKVIRKMFKKTQSDGLALGSMMNRYNLSAADGNKTFDGWNDATKTGQERTEFLEEEDKRYKLATNNGKVKKAPNSKTNHKTNAAAKNKTPYELFEQEAHAIAARMLTFVDKTDLKKPNKANKELHKRLQISVDFCFELGITPTKLK